MPRKHVRRGPQKQDRPKYDLGTPESQRRRLEALGPQRAGWPMPDLSYAESPLGCLLWQGYLHSEYSRAKEMYDAGMMFVGWWTLVHPKCHAQGTLGQFQPKEAANEIDTAEAERSLRDSSEYLKKERQVYDAVVNTCVYQRLNFDTVNKLRTGLCRLIQWRKAQREAA